MAMHRFDGFRPDRRGFLLAGAAAILCPTSRAATPACTLTPEQEIGPYYIDDAVLRHDITEERPGIPMRLRIALVDAKSCAPLENAAVDIWHCDASGLYSGFIANSPDGGPGGRGRGGPGGPPPDFGGPPPEGRGRRGPGGPGDPGGPPPARVTDPSRFLRGIQLTSKNGIVEFASLYPGWYAGRCIHVHLKVRLGGTAGERYAGGHVSHTGQLFPPEQVSADVARLEPYAKRLNIHRTLQSEDGIFNGQHGSECMLETSRLARASDSGGFLATVTLAVDPDATPAPVGGGGRRGGRGGR